MQSFTQFQSSEPTSGPSSREAIREAVRAASLLREAFSPADIDKVRTDASAWTKNIRRIKTGQELATVCAAYDRWSKYLDDFIYRRLMGMKTFSYNSDKETWWQKDLREKTWSLVITNPFRDDIRSAYNAWNIDHGAFTADGQSWWQTAYSDFNNRRNNIYAKFGKYVREMMAALDAYLEHELATKKTLPDYAASTTLQIDGLPVTIVQSEASRSSDNPRDILKHIRTGIAAVRKAGFGKFLTHLKFEIRMDEQDSGKGTSSAAGLYKHRTNDFSTIDVLAWGTNSPRTVTHEIGHHVHYLLTPKRRDAWLAFIKQHRVSFNAEDVASIHTAIDKAYNAHKDEHHRGYTIENFWAKLVPQAIANAVTREKYAHWFKSGEGVTFQFHEVLDPFHDDIQHPDERNRMKAEFDAASREPFTLHLPSEYASKNEDEAFAEVFCYYVLKSAPIAPITRATFEDVVFN